MPNDATEKAPVQGRKNLKACPTTSTAISSTLATKPESNFTKRTTHKTKSGYEEPLTTVQQRNKTLHNLICKIAKATMESNVHIEMEKLSQIDSGVFEYLVKIPSSRWCQAHAIQDGFSTFGITTNNFSESLNLSRLTRSERLASAAEFLLINLKWQSDLAAEFQHEATTLASQGKKFWKDEHERLDSMVGRLKEYSCDSEKKYPVFEVKHATNHSLKRFVNLEKGSCTCLWPAQM
jgi:hypothetical protein